MQNITPYFEHLASHLTQQLGAGAAKAVVDARQRTDTTAWTAVAVHPLQVLETEYQAVVREEERKGTGVEERRELQASALSRFFTLSSGDALPLDLPESEFRKELENMPLVGEQIASLRASLDMAERLLDANAERDTVFQHITQFAQDAFNLLAVMAPERDEESVTPLLWDVLTYLGFTGARSVNTAKQVWLAAKGADKSAVVLKALLAELRNKVVHPLSSPEVAAASARALYNIREFFLYRLLHRFEGVSQAGRMTPVEKAQVSGMATDLLHKWPWLSVWHESKIADLSNRFELLNQKLRRFLKCDQDCLRFHLKGGRALFTALGTPAKGANDWDTGVLINPDLDPRSWYIVFAAVNDLILATLDHYRFSFTAEMHRHAEELLAWRPQAPVMFAAVEKADELDQLNHYSLRGAIAESEAEQTAPRSRIPAIASAASDKALQLMLRSSSGRVGINGELIDIGIATRSSVELREHWSRLRIVNRPGVSNTLLPVPDLGYFVDDFSVIIRDALQADGPVDRKLAKRLIRLDAVLGSKDRDFVEEVRHRRDALKEHLPATMGTLVPHDTPESRLQAWGLYGLIESISDLSPAGRRSWLAAFDAWLARMDNCFEHGDAQATWDQIADAFKDDRALASRCRQHLNTLASLRLFANKAVASFRVREQALGFELAAENKERQSAALNLAKKLANFTGMNPNGAGRFILTGAAAARMQCQRAGLELEAMQACWPVDMVEMDFHLPADKLTALHDTVVTLIAFVGMSNQWIADQPGDDKKTVVIRAAGREFAAGGDMPETQPAVLVIRAVPRSEDILRSMEWLEGTPVMSTRWLTREYRRRAGMMHDFDLRNLAKSTANVLAEEVLGRQL